MIRAGLVQRDQGYGVYTSSYDKQNRHGPGAATHEERPYVAVAGRIKEDEYTDPIKPENITRTERSINYNDVFQRRPTDITKQLSDILARTVGRGNAPPGGPIGPGGPGGGGPGGPIIPGAPASTAYSSAGSTAYMSAAGSTDYETAASSTDYNTAASSTAYSTADGGSSATSSDNSADQRALKRHFFGRNFNSLKIVIPGQISGLWSPPGSDSRWLPPWERPQPGLYVPPQPGIFVPPAVPPRVRRGVHTQTSPDFPSVPTKTPTPPLPDFPDTPTHIPRASTTEQGTQYDAPALRSIGTQIGKLARAPVTKSSTSQTANEVPEVKELREAQKKVAESATKLANTAAQTELGGLDLLKAELDYNDLLTQLQQLQAANVDAALVAESDLLRHTNKALQEEMRAIVRLNEKKISEMEKIITSQKREIRKLQIIPPGPSITDQTAQTSPVKFASEPSSPELQMSMATQTSPVTDGKTLRIDVSRKRAKGGTSDTANKKRRDDDDLSPRPLSSRAGGYRPVADFKPGFASKEEIDERIGSESSSSPSGSEGSLYSPSGSPL